MFSNRNRNRNRNTNTNNSFEGITLISSIPNILKNMKLYDLDALNSLITELLDQDISKLSFISSIDLQIDDTILQDPYSWYLKKNPNFSPIKEINLVVPEYKYIIMNMVKDLIYILINQKMYKHDINRILSLKNKHNIKQMTTKSKQIHAKISVNMQIKPLINYYFTNSKTRNSKTRNSKTRNSNNQFIHNNKSILHNTRRISLIITYIMDTLQLINKLLVNNYDYKIFIVILYNYLIIFTAGTKDNMKNNNILKESLKTLDMLLATTETPFIILPTIKQLKIEKILTLMTAPILNFRLSNRIKDIHGGYNIPIEELEHDIVNHGNRTHKINEYLNTKNHNQNKISEIYENRFNTINKIEPLFKNEIYLCIFFNIFHEHGFQDDNLTLDALDKSFTHFYNYINKDTTKMSVSIINNSCNLKLGIEVFNDNITKLYNEIFKNSKFSELLRLNNQNI